MLYALLYVVVRLMLEGLIVRGRSETRLRAEVLALRHQLGVLERQVGRPRWQPTDRLVLAAISRVLPRPDWRSLMPRPETLLRWHRELVRRKWAACRRRPRRRRPNARSELHDLILKLARENEGWGYRRIVGELRKLGHRCSNITVRKVLRSYGLEPAPAPQSALLVRVRTPVLSLLVDWDTLPDSEPAQFRAARLVLSPDLARRAIFHLSEGHRGVFDNKPRDDERRDEILRELTRDAKDLNLYDD